MNTLVINSFLVPTLNTRFIEDNWLGSSQIELQSLAIAFAHGIRNQDE